MIGWLDARDTVSVCFAKGSVLRTVLQLTAHGVATAQRAVKMWTRRGLFCNSVAGVSEALMCFLTRSHAGYTLVLQLQLPSVVRCSLAAMDDHRRSRSQNKTPQRGTPRFHPRHRQSSPGLRLPSTGSRSDASRADISPGDASNDAAKGQRKSFD